MRVFFLGPVKSTFTKNDIEILKTKYELSSADTSIGGGATGAKNLVMLTARSIYEVLLADFVFAWFADYTTLFPAILAKILRKKMITVAGGYDVGYQPSLNYGAVMRPFRKFCVKNTFRLSDKIFPVSEYAGEALNRLFKTPRDKYEHIYNCIRVDRFPINDIDKTERALYLTISQAHSKMEFILKGGDKFIAIASRNPDKRFVFAGLRGEALNEARKIGGDLSNLDIMPGPLDLFSELIPLYKKSYAYLQLSIEESFGVAVAEAMLCGCAPIIYPNAALPEVAGEYAITCNDEKSEDLALKIAAAVPSQDRIAFSKHAEQFDFSIRKSKLLTEIEKILK
jgi:glycosyltransferase involved in cell wall biosynthesis